MSTEKTGSQDRREKPDILSPLTERQWADARAMNANGSALAEVAKQFGLGVKDVFDHSIRNGWNGNRNANNRISEEQWAEARDLHDKGATNIQVAQHLGVSPRSVRCHAFKYGWEANSGVNPQLGMLIDPGKKRTCVVDADEWAEARVMRMSGASLSEIARKFNISVSTVSGRAIKDGWDTPGNNEVIAKAMNRSYGIVSEDYTESDKYKQELDLAVSRAVAVIERHKSEWEEHKLLIDQAIREQDFALAKLAKITAETIVIRQSGERRTWGLERPEGANNTNVNVNVNQVVGHPEQRKAALDMALRMTLDNEDPTIGSEQLALATGTFQTLRRA